MSFLYNAIKCFFLFIFGSCVYADANVYLDTDRLVMRQAMPSSSVMWNMSRHQNNIALTFDDGPDMTVTPKILDVLLEKNVKATFFLVGHMITKYPHIVKMIHADGHHIANHTWSHYRLDEMNYHQIFDQMYSTERVLSALNIPMSPFFRPPGGRYNNLVINAVADHKLTMVMWDVNAADYRRANGHFPSPASIIRRVIRNVKPGSIILMHNSEVTLKALPELIDQLHAKDFKIGYIQWRS